MAIAIKRIMLVTRNVQFAIDVKRSLEALGEYSVTTVADVRNAIEQLREHPLQLLLLDTSQPEHRAGDHDRDHPFAARGHRDRAGAGRAGNAPSRRGVSLAGLG